MSSDSDSEYDPALEDPAQCRICYGLTGEEVLDDQVCLCTGNLRYICLYCLRREVAREGQNIHRTSMPYCSSCHGAFTSIRYEIGPDGQFQNVDYVSLRGVRTFWQYMAVASTRDYTADVILVALLGIMVAIIPGFNWFEPILWNESLMYRVTMILIFLIAACFWLFFAAQLFSHLRSHHREYRKWKEEKRRLRKRK